MDQPYERFLADIDRLLALPPDEQRAHLEDRDDDRHTRQDLLLGWVVRFTTVKRRS